MDALRSADWNVPAASTSGAGLEAGWGVHHVDGVADSMAEHELASMMRLVLRHVMGNGSVGPLAHAKLKAKILVATTNNVRKCVLEWAIMSLMEQNLIARHGHGNYVVYTIPEESFRRAEALAYGDLQCDAGRDVSPAPAGALPASPLGAAFFSPRAASRASTLWNASRTVSPRTHALGIRSRGAQKANGRGPGGAASKRTLCGDLASPQGAFKRVRVEGWPEPAGGEEAWGGAVSCAMQLSP